MSSTALGAEKPILSQEHESTETSSFNETVESKYVESTPVAEESREAHFYQIEKGMFYLGLEKEFLHDEPHSYYYSREGDLVLEKVIEDEMVKASQQLSKYEGETESTLSDITWDDYNSGSYETWLHFSFSDGTEVDEELSYSPSIVENVDFVDITGDGKGEVLIYRYFANTATEYTLINFF